MQKRQVHMGDLLCACGAKGLTRWSQNKSPARAGGKVAAVVLSLVGRFTLTRNRGDLPPIYRCSHCGRTSSARPHAVSDDGYSNDA